MAEKIISIPFDYNNFLQIRSTIWLFSVKRIIKHYIFYTIIPVIILAFEFTSKEKDPLPVGIIAGFGLLIYASLKWGELYNNRKRFFDQTYLFGVRYKQDAMECKYILSEDFLIYEDKEKLYRLNWDIFNPYIIFKDTILLSAKDTEGVMFSISRKELGDEDYQEVSNILNDKIGKA